MGDSRVFQPSSEALYWYELYKYASPYADVGASVLELARLFAANELGAEAQIQQLAQKLAALSVQTRQLLEFIDNRLANIPLKEHSGEVLSIKNALDEFARLRSQGILDYVVAESVSTKRKIQSFLAQADTPLSYHYAYSTLKCALLPMRVACYFFYNLPKPETFELVRGDLLELLEGGERAVEVARAVGRNRVAYDEEVFLYDELGPTWGTEFSVTVDGQWVYGSSFAPPDRNLNELRERARRKYEEFRERKADEVSQGLRRCQEDARALLTLTGG